MYILAKGVNQKSRDGVEMRRRMTEDVRPELGVDGAEQRRDGACSKCDPNREKRKKGKGVGG
jgi:hypothetical protein